jgi:hypothetical protein
MFPTTNLEVRLNRLSTLRIHYYLSCAIHICLQFLHPFLKKKKKKIGQIDMDMLDYDCVEIS